MSGKGRGVLVRIGVVIIFRVCLLGLPAGEIPLPLRARAIASFPTAALLPELLDRLDHSGVERHDLWQLRLLSNPKSLSAIYRIVTN